MTQFSLPFLETIIVGSLILTGLALVTLIGLLTYDWLKKNIW